MKSIVLAAFAAALVPAAAAAQNTPAADGPPPPTAAQMSAMHATFEQLALMRAQARAQMLASLSPQHRAQLAGLIGQQAVAANPDPQTFARQVDALLSRGEAQNVLSISAGARASEHSAMEAARAQMEASLPADEKARFAARDQERAAKRASHVEPTPDAGRELLHALLEPDHEHGGPPHQ